nr:MAG TPA: docking domain containing protein [Caudoviricetes sp.]
MAKITVTADRGVSTEILAIAADAVREALRSKPTDGEN